MRAVLFGLSLGAVLLFSGFVLVVITDQDAEPEIPARPVATPLHRDLSNQERLFIGARIKVARA